MFKKYAAIKYYSQFSCQTTAISFHLITTPPGRILHLAFSSEDHQQAVSELATMFPGIKEHNPVKEEMICENLLKQVITGKGLPKADFANNPFLAEGTAFQRNIWQAISQIKPGETITYGELASTAGYASAARAAGHACNRNPLALIIPCHRVVAANGPGGFAGDLSIKLELLAMEASEKEDGR
jgi:methylated-DNA-[protein]-cysteine S-methyltransferase